MAVDDSVLDINLTTHLLDENEKFIAKKWEIKLKRSDTIGDAIGSIPPEIYGGNEVFWEIWTDDSMLCSSREGTEKTVSVVWKRGRKVTDWQLFGIRPPVLKKWIGGQVQLLKQIPPAPKLGTKQKPLYVKVTINGFKVNAKLFERKFSVIDRKAVKKYGLQEQVDPRFQVFTPESPMLIQKTVFKIGSKTFGFPLTVQSILGDMVLGRDFLNHFKATIDFSKMELNIKDHPDGPIPLFSEEPVKKLETLKGKQKVLVTSDAKINTLPPADKEEIEPYMVQVTEDYEKKWAKMDWKTDRKKAVHY